MKSTRSIVYMKDLIGMEVISREGELLGRVEELAAEVHAGTLAFLVMRYTDQDKRFMIPYSSTDFDATQRRLVVGIDREVFENTPGMAVPLDAA